MTSTVSVIQPTCGWSNSRDERARPGELIHIDVKKLGRIKDGVGGRHP